MSCKTQKSTLAQSFLAQEYFKAKRDKLKLDRYILDKDIHTQRQFSAIINSNCLSGTSAWLLALPNAGLRQCMTPMEFQAALCMRLLIPQFNLGSTCELNTCTKHMDRYGYHALVCRGHMSDRHDIVRNSLIDLMRLAGFNPIREAGVTCLGTQSNRPTLFRPADILCSGDDFDKDCVDVTVVSPLTSNNQNVVKPGFKAQKAESLKIKKHMLACEEAGYGFKPFAVDIFGIMADETKVLFRRVINSIARRCGYETWKAQTIAKRKLSIAIQIGLSRQILAARGAGDV